MLDLTYSGNINLAQDFLKNAWTPQNSFTEEFWNDFTVQLAKGQYWSSIKELNKNSVTW
jgi:hypothetical protein